MRRCVELRARLKEVARSRAAVLQRHGRQGVRAGAARVPARERRLPRRQFELYSRVNVGVAVAGPGRARRADRLRRRPEVARADRRARRARWPSASARARSRRRSSSGGTFTVSNLGMYGIDELHARSSTRRRRRSSPSARWSRRPSSTTASVVARDMMGVTLVCDHRILYGADAAQFLARIRELLEQPLRWRSSASGRAGRRGVCVAPSRTPSTVAPAWSTVWLTGPSTGCSGAGAAPAARRAGRLDDGADGPLRDARHRHGGASGPRAPTRAARCSPGRGGRGRFSLRERGRRGAAARSRRPRVAPACGADARPARVGAPGRTRRTTPSRARSRPGGRGRRQPRGACDRAAVVGTLRGRERRRRPVGLRLRARPAVERDDRAERDHRDDGRGHRATSRRPRDGTDPRRASKPMFPQAIRASDIRQRLVRTRLPEAAVRRYKRRSGSGRGRAVTAGGDWSVKTSRHSARLACGPRDAGAVDRPGPCFRCPRARRCCGRARRLGATQRARPSTARRVAARLPIAGRCATPGRRAATASAPSERRARASRRRRARQVRAAAAHHRPPSGRGRRPRGGSRSPPAGAPRRPVGRRRRRSAAREQRGVDDEGGDEGRPQPRAPQPPLQARRHAR